jgi:hypothetical protein
MNACVPRLRAPLCALIAASLAAWSSPARAVDKLACVAAAEAGQQLRSHGQLVSAREQLLVCSSPDCPAVVSQDCTGWLGEVQRSLASVIIKAKDPGGQVVTDVGVSVDGSVRPERAPTAAIELDPGEHTFRCTHDGFTEAGERVTLAEGERGREIVCQLAPLQPSQPAAPSRRGPPAPAEALRDVPAPSTASSGLPWVVWPLGGLGVAGLGGFAALGLWGKSEQNAAERPGGCAPNCTSSEVDSIQLKFTAANVSLAVGLAALGAATIIGLLHASSSPDPPPSLPARSPALP